MNSKLRYLFLELFGDLETYMFGTFEFYMTVAVYLFAFWFRIYIHYLTGYLFLLVGYIIPFIANSFFIELF